MGFMLLGLLSGVVDGNTRNAVDAYTAALFYAIVYAIMSVGAFGVLLYLSRAGFDCENLDDLRGLNRRSPWTAFLMLLVMFSLTGVPPMAGFYAKLAVISAAVSAGYLWLAVAAVMFSLVGAFYYLRVVKLMYFDDPVDTTPLERRIGFGALLSANSLSLLLFGILPQPLMAVCFAAIIAL
jgi:NADH-quinone oxidoreductase subunit N